MQTRPNEVFTLQEFITSQTATRNGYEEQFQPPEHLIDNMKDMYEHIVLPLREYLCYGKVVITSGYRCKRLNHALVNASRTSRHLTGEAVDLEYWRDGVEDNNEIINAVIALGLDYDKMIDEYGLRWIHIQRRKENNRGIMLNIT